MKSKAKIFTAILSVFVLCAVVISCMSAVADGARSDYSAKFTAGGFSHNSKFDSYDKFFIIDVSSHNGTIDFNRVYNAGIEGVFIRCGYRGYSTGKFNTDEKFETNYTAAKAAGLKVGVYFYSQAVSRDDAKDEADYVLSILNGRELDLPVAMDVEYGPDGKTGRVYDAKLLNVTETLIINRFVQVIEDGGYSPLLYTNLSIISEKISTSFLTCPVWVANYASTCSYSGSYNYWQYTCTGSVDGVSGNVDVNVMYATAGSIVTKGNLVSTTKSDGTTAKSSTTTAAATTAATATTTAAETTTAATTPSIFSIIGAFLSSFNISSETVNTFLTSSISFLKTIATTLINLFTRLKALLGI